MKARNLAASVIVVMGLMSFAGSGCSKKDKKAQHEAEMLRAQLAAKEAELECKSKALTITCAYADTACVKAKDESIAACNAAAGAASAQFATTSSTVTRSSVATATSTAGDSFTVK